MNYEGPLICSGNEETHEQEYSRIHQIEARRDDVGCSPDWGLVELSLDQVAGVRVANLHDNRNYA